MHKKWIAPKNAQQISPFPTITAIIIITILALAVYIIYDQIFHPHPLSILKRTFCQRSVLFMRSQLYKIINKGTNCLILRKKGGVSCEMCKGPAVTFVVWGYRCLHWKIVMRMNSMRLNEIICMNRRTHIVSAQIWNWSYITWKAWPSESLSPHQ